MAKNSILKFQDGSYGYVDLPASLNTQRNFSFKENFCFYERTDDKSPNVPVSVNIVKFYCVYKYSYIWPESRVP